MFIHQILVCLPISQEIRFSDVQSRLIQYKG
jgi:hypothetical protein